MNNNFKEKLHNGPTINELPSMERPREKILTRGVRTLSNTELLAVLINSGTAEESSIAVAARVLALEGGSLGHLASYEPEEFCAVKGIGRAKSCTIVAALELGRRMSVSRSSEKPLLDNPDQVASLFMEDMRYLKKEVFRVALVNVKNEIIMQEDISIGGLHSSTAHPREVFSNAVKKGAHAVILVHNHPSGDPTPSPSDITTTRQLKEAGKILGINVLDHILIGDGKFTSFKQEGLL